MFVMMWNGEVESDEWSEVREVMRSMELGVEDVKVMKEESVVSEELMWKAGKVNEIRGMDGEFEKWLWI